MPQTRAIARIVDAGADHGAEPRPVDHDPERDRDHHRDGEHRQPIEREEHAHRLHRAAQLTRRRGLPGVAGPDHQAEVGDDEGEAERQQHLRQHLTFEAAQQEALDDAADHRHGEAAEQRGEPEVHAPVEERHAEIGAQHEEGAVHQVRNPHQPEDQREAGGEKEQQAAERETVDREDDGLRRRDLLHHGGSDLSCPGRAVQRGARRHGAPLHPGPRLFAS